MPTPAPSTPQICAFNTGRTYTAKGQRIAYLEISRDRDPHVPIAQVVFVDVDRHIDGLLHIAVMAGEAVNDRGVLSTYDHGLYRHCPDHALLDRLKAAAEAI